MRPGVSPRQRMTTQLAMLWLTIYNNFNASTVSHIVDSHLSSHSFILTTRNYRSDLKWSQRQFKVHSHQVLLKLKALLPTVITRYLPHFFTHFVACQYSLIFIRCQKDTPTLLERVELTRRMSVYNKIFNRFYYRLMVINLC